MEVFITIPELIPGRNTREHFWQYKKRRDRYQWIIQAEASEKFTGPVIITLTRYSVGMMDYDNLVSCGKPVLDALKRAGVIEDDRMKIVGQPTYTQVKIKRGEQARYEITVVPRSAQQKKFNLL